MKEMKYGFNLLNKTEILDDGNYKGYNYVIVNYGMHPCAYIEIPKGHRFYEKDYEEIDLDCHGGLTFSDFRDFGFGEKYYIGWDYAHLGDYIGARSFPSFNEYAGGTDKRWTTAEILDEVREVIEQIEGGE